MAKDGLGTIIGLGVAGVAAYWLYETFFVNATPATPTASTPAAPTGSGGGTVAASTPAWMASLPALGSEMVTRAGADNNAVSIWNGIYNQLRAQRNMAPLTSDQAASILNSFGFGGTPINALQASLLQATGETAEQVASTPVSAAQYTNAIFGLGLGLRGVNAWRGMGAFRPANPIMVIPFATRRVARRAF